MDAGKSGAPSTTTPALQTSTMPPVEQMPSAPQARQGLNAGKGGAPSTMSSALQSPTIPSSGAGRFLSGSPLLGGTQYQGTPTFAASPTGQITPTVAAPPTGQIPQGSIYQKQIADALAKQQAEQEAAQLAKSDAVRQALAAQAYWTSFGSESSGGAE